MNLAKFIEDRSGKPSSDRLWYHIAYAASTSVVIMVGMRIAEDPPPEKQHAFTVMMTMYLAIVAGSKFASKVVQAVITLKGGKDADKQDKKEAV